MIIFNKIENNMLILKAIDGNNVTSFIIKIKISNFTLINFRNLYHNLHKGINHSFMENGINVEFQDNTIKFYNNNFEFSFNKNNDILDMFDKIITNLMINDLDNESPKKK